MSAVSLPLSGVAAAPGRPAHGYLPALDGLRALSIALVVLSHVGLGRWVPGGLGVTVFFFISGYIITRLMLQEQERAGRIAVRTFYMRRVLRLMPALVVFVAVSAVLVPASGQAVPLRDALAALFYLGNYWNIAGGFHSGPAPSPLSITWSLAVEEHYYLVYPLLMACLAARPRRLLAVLTALLVAVLIWRCVLVYGVGLAALRPNRIYMATDTRLDSILYGAWLAVASAPGVINASRVPGWVGGKPDVRAFGLGLVLLAATLVYRDPLFRDTVRYSVQGVALVLVLPYLVFGAGLATRWLSSGPLRYLGWISYSLYLYHWLVHVLLTLWWPQAGVGVQMAGMVLLAWPAAHLSWRWVERAGLIWRRRWLDT